MAVNQGHLLMDYGRSDEKAFEKAVQCGISGDLQGSSKNRVVCRPALLLHGVLDIQLQIESTKF